MTTFNQRARVECTDPEHTSVYCDTCGAGPRLVTVPTCFYCGKPCVRGGHVEWDGRGGNNRKTVLDSEGTYPDGSPVQRSDASLRELEPSIALHAGCVARWTDHLLGDAERAAALEDPTWSGRVLLEGLLRCESPPEELLWRACYGLGLHERGLEPQVETGPGYRVDLGVARLKYGVEVDGYRYHGGQTAFTADRQRQRRLEDWGWTVTRFAASEVLGGAERCAAEVRSRLAQLDNSSTEQ